MQSKYKAPGVRALILLCALLALITGWSSEGGVRVVAWIGAAMLLFWLARYPLLAGVAALSFGALAVALLATGDPLALMWIWVLPLSLQTLTGRLGIAINAVGFLLSAGLMAWHLPWPAAIIAIIALAGVWLLCLEQRRLHFPAPPSSGARWLLPAATLDADIRHEARRVERESLLGEVVVFGCARSTSGDMEQLCRLLQDQLALYERAYRLNDFGIAVVLVANDATAASQRREQLQHAIAPHRLVSSTPIQDIGEHFQPTRARAPRRPREALPWQ